MVFGKDDTEGGFSQLRIQHFAKACLLCSSLRKESIWRPAFSRKGSLHAENSENRERSSPVHTQWPDRNSRGYPATRTNARRRDIWAAVDFGFEGRDARQPGCRQISS
jgi:hypothetical protein